MTEQLVSQGPVPGKYPLRRASAAFIVLVTILFIAGIGWSSWHARATDLQETETTTTNMTKALAQHAGDTIGSVDNVLVGLVKDMESGPLDAAGYDRMQQFMRQRVTELPLLHGLFIYDEKGRWLINSQKTLLKNMNNSDREYFIFNRAFADRGPHVGQSIRSRSTGEWVIPISRRFNHADGSFAGVVLATVKMSYFKAFYEGFDIGKEGVITLMTDTGTLLLRRPFDEALIGRNLSAGPVYQSYLSHGSPGTAMLTSVIDKVERLYSYRHLDGYPILILTALSKKEILANWRNETRYIALGSAFVIALLWLLGWHLIRQIAISEHVQAELHEAKNDLERSNDELAALALQDGLTGLANRRRFDAVLEAEYGRAIRNGTSLALVMIDVDYFKKYNDTYGHLQGDECLKEVSRVIAAASARSTDLASRYGGEEMAVLLPGSDIAGATAVAENICLAVHKLGIAHSATINGVVTISAGVAAMVPVRNGSPPQALIRAADIALYAAKGAGRNRVNVFSPEETLR